MVEIAENNFKGRIMSFTPFNPKSKRAIAGLAFQQRVFENFTVTFPDIRFEMTWDFFKSKNPELTDKDLAVLEKEHGDITYLLHGERHFVECCYAMGTEISRLCEMKRRKFVGKNKWYCYGFSDNDEIILIPSFVWKKYTEQIEPADRSCRIVPLSSIRNLKAGCVGIQEYWLKAHQL